MAQNWLAWFIPDNLFFTNIFFTHKSCELEFRKSEIINVVFRFSKTAFLVLFKKREKKFTILRVVNEVGVMLVLQEIHSEINSFKNFQLYHFHVKESIIHSKIYIECADLIRIRNNPAIQWYFQSYSTRSFLIFPISHFLAIILIWFIASEMI